MTHCDVGWSRSHPPHQLFDLVADPGERRNLWNNPEAGGVKQDLLNAMLEFHLESTVQTKNARRLIVGPPGAESLQ
jgi:arylsulfatase